VKAEGSMITKSQQLAKTTIQNITKVFAELGIPTHAVEVSVHEIQKSHRGIGGSPLRRSLRTLLLD